MMQVDCCSLVQSQLPETGVPVTRQRVDQMKEMFEEYVRNRTLQNWKFWIVSFVVITKHREMQTDGDSFDRENLILLVGRVDNWKGGKHTKLG